MVVKTPLTIATKNVKYLGINFKKDVQKLYMGNFFGGVGLKKVDLNRMIQHYKDVTSPKCLNLLQSH